MPNYPRLFYAPKELAMNDLRRTVTLTLAMLLVAAGCGFAQSDAPKKPLTEEALVKLIKGDLEEEVIVTLVKKRGVSFTADADALDRLKQAGATSAVLAAVRSAAVKETPAAEDTEGGDKDKGKVLATEKHENGMVVEVTEVKPDADRPLLTIRWRYRNTGKRTIQMFGEGPTFVVPARSDERWLFLHAIFFLSGGKDDENQFRHSIVNDTGGKLWCKPIGKKPVKIAPGDNYEFWAKFDLPDRTTKKISLQLEDVPLMEGIPVQWGKK
jgi:hypothetical protein